MKPYAVYKDSGIDWLGEIPEHWDIIRIKRLSPVKRGASPRPIDNPKYFDDNGEFAWVRIADVTASNKYLLTTTQKLSKLGSALSVKQYPDDLFVSITGSVGKPIITKIKCCIHDGFVYFPQLKINKYFIYYLFDSGQLFQGLGKFGTQLNLNTDTIGNIQIPLPPPEEQKTIAHFLDYKIEQIEQYIRNKQRLIELLNEQKTAIINRAVTKGINPNAPMKHSGIEWLGEIPKSWTFIPLKRKWSVIDCKHRTVPFTATGIPIASIGEVKGINIDLSMSKKTSYEEYMDLIDGNRKPNKGDIIYSRNATVGEAAFVNVDIDFCMGQDVCLIRSQKENQKFLVYQLRSKAVLNQIEVLMIGSTFKRINVSDIKNLLICCPPLEEQNQIVKFIESESAKIDLAIAQIGKEIELIQEYRTTLISDAVTGKIDVRGFDNSSDSGNCPTPPELATM